MAGGQPARGAAPEPRKIAAFIYPESADASLVAKALGNGVNCAVLRLGQIARVKDVSKPTNSSNTACRGIERTECNSLACRAGKVRRPICVGADD